LSLPIWLQFVVGYDALQTGFVILALAVGAFAASGLAGGLGSRVSPVRLVQIGIVLEVIGVAGVGFSISPESTWINVVPWLFVYGLGVGMATAQLTNVILRDVPVQESGQASGTQSTSRQLGSALGIAVLGTILFTSAQLQLTSSLTDAGMPDAQVTATVSAVIDSAGGAIMAFDADPATRSIADSAKQAISDGTRNGAFAAAGFLVLGFFSTLALGRGRQEEDEELSEVEAGAKPAAS
jgi:Na+/melibiose symporter-like transporter